MKKLNNIIISIYFTIIIIITLFIDLLAPLYYNETTNTPYELKDSIPYSLFLILFIRNICFISY